MKSIYQDKRWYQLQAAKEQGALETYVLEELGMRVEYNFVKRKAGSHQGKMYYDILTPRGFGGPYLFCDNKNNISEFVSLFNQRFGDFCRDNHIIAEYVKFDPWENIIEELENIYKIEPHGNLYCNNITSNFFDDQYTSKVRGHIRKAMKNGVHVKFDFNGNTIKNLLKVYEYTSNKYNTSDYYKFDYNFIKKYFEILKESVCISHAIYKDQIISSAIFVWGEDIFHYHISGNNPKYRELQGNSLLLYEAAKYAQTLGKKLFDMGGSVYGSAVENFKSGFLKNEKDVMTYYTGKKIRNKEVYQELVKQNGKNCSGYFPEYRI